MLLKWKLVEKGIPTKMTPAGQVLWEQYEAAHPRTPFLCLGVLQRAQRIAGARKSTRIGENHFLKAISEKG